MTESIGVVKLSDIRPLECHDDDPPVSPNDPPTYLFTRDGIAYYRGIHDNWIVRVGFKADDMEHLLGHDHVAIEYTRDDREIVRPDGAPYVLLDGDTHVATVPELLPKQAIEGSWALSHKDEKGVTCCTFYASKEEALRVKELITQALGGLD